MARERNSSSPLLTLIAVVVAVAALHVAKEILLPLALAVLISFLLTPLANRLERLGLGRILSVISVAAVTFTVLGVLTWVVTLQLFDLGNQLSTYKDQLVAKVREIRPGESKLLKDVSDTIEDVQKAATGEEPDGQDGKGKRGVSKTGDKKAAATATKETTTAEIPTATDVAPEDAGVSDGEKALRGAQSWVEWASEGFQWRQPQTGSAKKEPVDVRLVGTAESPLDQVIGWLGPLVGPLTTGAITVVLVIFILMKREDQRNRLLQLFGANHLHATTEALTDVTERVSRYLRMQFLINAGYGMAVGTGLWLMGVPSALMWGVLSFSLRFLPYIGPWLSAVMPLFVSIATSQGWTQPVLVVVWFAALELVVNNVAEPLLYGRSTGVSGVGVIVAAIFWTWIWGTIGLMLAMPLTVCMVVMAQYIPGLRFLTVLLGDQPPMSLQDRVYQRLLAGDVAEAKQLSMQFLKTATLTELYDQILIPALAFAERDRHAGLLHEEQEQAVEDSARDLVEELGETAVAEGSAKAASAEVVADFHRARVLCIPLHDEADEISGMMLKQLLEAEGFEVETAAVHALTGELVELVESSKIDITVVSILPPFPPRNSRLLCRRLRDRYPTLPVIVGYWCGGCTPELERRLCADDGETTTNLAAAVERVKAISIRPQITEKVG